ncbi:hypothetical protein HPB48_007547 [Haemaphysalis longicornis]|uniref:Uncharacterized protein n=1 Tax=Haemaphysalis longicornis TaxID=44386 RepID=A0A9J6FDB5_HAELO|nr:hypothetical protein HPB48_007547 [Haemaphysalis longicornis]
MDLGAPAVSIDEVILQNFSLEANDKYFEIKAQNLLATTYLAGYCGHAALRKLVCTAGQANLVEDEKITTENAEIIANVNRGGLKFPLPSVVNDVMTAEIVQNKFPSEKYAVKFHSLPNQRQALFTMATNLMKLGDSSEECESGHSPHLVMQHILSTARTFYLKAIAKIVTAVLYKQKLF